MKKSTFLVLGVCSSLLLTGCDSPLKGEGGLLGNNYASYEVHLYDADFNHTEEIEAQYDSEGKLKRLELYMVFDQKTKQSDCDSWERSNLDAVDLNYDGVDAGCKITDKGAKVYYVMTDESLEDGYLKDGEDYDFDFEDVYYMFKTEEKAKETIDEYIEMCKENEVEYNDDNYVVIDGKKTGW